MLRFCLLQGLLGGWRNNALVNSLHNIGNLALRIVDVDGGMPALGDKFKATFEENVTLARNAALRKIFTPLQFGFGRNGFSWER